VPPSAHRGLIPECSYSTRRKAAVAVTDVTGWGCGLFLLGKMGDEDDIAGGAVARKYDLFAVG
jgi:hypothetical protein